MDWSRYYELTDRAADLEGSERDSWLEEHCADAPDLLDLVRRAFQSVPRPGFLEPPTDPERAGRSFEGTIVGEFKLLHEIGEGGTGVVYEAHQPALGRRVAVKLLPGIRRGRGEAHARFVREARVLARLDHPALLPVISSGDHGRIAWFAMPLVDGHDLCDEIKRQQAWRDLPSAETASACLLPVFGSADYVRHVVEIIASAADGLHVVHGKRIVHRDIKPSNLLLSRGGKVQVADFGLAQDDASISLTPSGALHGTPRYMSPEQFEAAPSVDGRSDVYSLAVVLYELLALQQPFRDVAIPALSTRIPAGEYPALRRLAPKTPVDLLTIVEHGMSVERDRRYPTAQAFADDLRRFARLEAIEARPLSKRIRAGRWLKRRPRQTFAVLGAVAGVALFSLAYDARQSIDEARSLGASIQRGVQALELEDPLAPMAVAHLVQAQDALERLGSRADASAFEGKLGEFRRLQFARVESLWAKGMGAEPVTMGSSLTRDADVRSLLEAIELATRLQRVFPGDEAIEQRAQVLALFPVVKVSLPSDLPPGQAVSARAVRIDAITGGMGEPFDLGRLPTASRLVPGDWRIEVTLAGEGVLEYDRFLRFGDVEVRIQPDVSALRRRPAAMVPLGGERIQIDSSVEAMCCAVRHDVFLEPYALDEAEVSNGEYLEFLDATGTPPPTFWARAGYDGDWRSLPGAGTRAEFLDLPAVGMTQKDMVAYAEWRGCRLPTHFELERGIRGAAMLRELDAGDRAHTEGRASSSFPRDSESIFASYVQETAVVRDPRFRQSPSGLYHAYGNVAEMTSSRVVERIEGRLESAPHSFYALGGAWDARVDKFQLHTHMRRRGIATNVDVTCGFRLARSLEPR